MLYAQLSRTTMALLLCAYIFHGCQQSKLNAREEDVAQTQIPQIDPSTEVITTATSPDATLAPTSSSDASPDAKHNETAVPDRDGQVQLVANAPQGNTLTYARADTTITEANDKEVARKRPATVQLRKTEEQRAVAKQAKKESASLTQKEWFSLFTKAVVQIEQDPEDGAAWGTMDQVLDQGAENDFLTASIMYPNDSNPATTYEYTPLHYAAARGILALVKELVERRSVSVVTLPPKIGPRKSRGSC